MSAEYDRALSRALAMPECPVVPFFGAFLRELREILSAPTIHEHPSVSVGDQPHPPKVSKSELRRERDQQQRQVVGEMN